MPKDEFDNKIKSVVEALSKLSENAVPIALIMLSTAILAWPIYRIVEILFG